MEQNEVDEFEDELEQRVPKNLILEEVKYNDLVEGQPYLIETRIPVYPTTSKYKGKFVRLTQPPNDNITLVGFRITNSSPTAHNMTGKSQFFEASWSRFYKPNTEKILEKRDVRRRINNATGTSVGDGVVSQVYTHKHSGKNERKRKRKSRKGGKGRKSRKGK